MQFKREKYLKQLIERMHNGEIKVITGIRRCGRRNLAAFFVFIDCISFMQDHIIVAT